MEVAQETPFDASAPRVGALLKQRREALGLSIADVAAKTRVPPRHLAAIEADAHDSLPALPFAIGFVKSFARALDLPADRIVEQFRAETTKTVHVPQHVPLEPLDEKRVPPVGLVAASVAAVALLIAGVGAYSAGWLGGEEEVPAVASDVAPIEPAPVDVAPAEVAPATNEFDVPPGTAQAQIQPAPTATAPAATSAPAPATTAATTAATGTPPPPAAIPAGPITISATEDAWLKVYDRTTRKAVKMGILKAGETYQVEGDPNQLLLWTGKAGALRISVGGQTLPPLGGPVETVRDVSLAPADLMARAG